MFRNVVLPTKVSGTLFLHSMPGYLEPLAQTEQALVATRIHEIICLTPKSQIQQLSPDYLAAIETASLPCQHCQFDIVDYGIPSNENEFLKLVRECVQSLKTGNNLLVHCAAGVGRTGLLATCLLIEIGYSMQSAVSQIRQSGSNAETEAQRDLIERMFAARLDL